MPNHRLFNTLELSSSSKLTKSGMRNCFSIDPIQTCIGRTEACKDCYAFKGRHVFNMVKNRRIENTTYIIEHINNPSIIENNLYMMIHSKKQSNFRIHEAGDFFNNKYINIWANVVNKLPKKFWSYTRSFNLDFTNLLKNKNMVLYASADQYNINEAQEFAKKYNTKIAYGPTLIDDDPIAQKLINNGSIVCPSILAHQQRGDTSIKCEDCKICINGIHNVIFPKH